jgi:hypothetical protein
MLSLSYIRRDALVTILLVAGTFLVTSYRPEHDQEEMRVQIQGVLNSMGGAELTPQRVPKPETFFQIKAASDHGWDVSIKVINFMLGEDSTVPNPQHLAVGYPYFFFNGQKQGRLYDLETVRHFPKFPDGEYIFTMAYEMPDGRLYRLYDKPIAQSTLVKVKNGQLDVSLL